MENLNAEEVKQMLEAHKKRRCYECPIGKEEIAQLNKPCGTMIAENCLSLITSQDQRIKELNEENERLRGENAKYEAENHEEFNKWLKLEEETKRHHAELFEEAKIAVKEETVRKMQERLRQCFDNTADRLSVYTEESVLFAIYQVAKEMLEGEK